MKGCYCIIAINTVAYIENSNARVVNLEDVLPVVQQASSVLILALRSQNLNL